MLVVRSSRLQRQSGLTLVEILVVIGVIGLLIALFLPAVQMAREASRRSQCANKLRQIGLALQGYLATFDCFPTAYGAPDVGPNPRPGPHPYYRIRLFSTFTQLLPYLDQVPLSQSINFNLGLSDPYDPAPYLNPASSAEGNRTAMATVLNVLLCPSDGAAQAGETGGSNYRANQGSNSGFIADWSPTCGSFTPTRYLRPAGHTDGLSQTAAFGEKLRGQIDGPFAPRVGMFSDSSFLQTNDATAFRNQCREHLGPPELYRNSAGLSWFVGSLAHTNYNHGLEPNASMPDCALFGTYPPAGIFGLRSNHPGGVTVGMADGSVRFVKNGINFEVWRALGTRAGGEVIDQGSY